MIKIRMSFIDLQKYTMNIKGDKYIFSQHNVNFGIEIEGTIKELAFQIYKNFLKNSTIHGMNCYWEPYGPFWLQFYQDGTPNVVLDFLSEIIPPPTPEFWNELNNYINRFFKLIIYS